MYATIDNEYDERLSYNEPIWDIDESVLPRSFVLNEQHHVVLVSSPRSGDPFNSRFMPKAHANRLPTLVDRAVRVLEEACGREHTDSKSMQFGNVRLCVRPSSGPGASYITVVLESIGK
ncbi:MAG: hypothetical protein JO263_04965 [Candidatus Eremiobacteraeota bacterium]|nr:hypothetical protein [Candidatus Eremiobacteraeota bacterium]